MVSKIKHPFPFEYTRFEKARIIGSRALQIAMGAPVLIEVSKKNPMEIALEEFEKNVIPVTVKRKSEGFVWLENSDYFSL